MKEYREWLITTRTYLKFGRTKIFLTKFSFIKDFGRPLNEMNAFHEAHDLYAKDNRFFKTFIYTVEPFIED